MEHQSIESKPRFSIAMAAALLYPNFIAMMEAGEAVTMMKLPVYLTTYGSTLLPGIFSAILVAYLENYFIKSYRECCGLYLHLYVFS